MLETYTIDCAQCSGLCCTALYFSKTDGFPEDKVAGKPCSHLKKDFMCDMHADLAAKGMKGCLGYDCFGAGQFVTQVVYKGETWQSSPQQKANIFKTFNVAFMLFQIGYYLECVRANALSKAHWQTVEGLLVEHQSMLHRLPDGCTPADVEAFRARVNPVLKSVVETVKQPNQKPVQDFMGKSFKGQDFSGQDLCMKLLIAANFNGCQFKNTTFLGADLRDANVTGADLSEALFLTQGQLNVVKGSEKTILPKHLKRPQTWLGR